MAGLYRGPIIDAHIHLWDLGMDRHPWLRPTGGAIQALGDLAPIRRNYLVDDYRRDAANQNVVAAVHIGAAWDRAEILSPKSDGSRRSTSRQASLLVISASLTSRLRTWRLRLTACPGSSAASASGRC